MIAKQFRRTNSTSCTAYVPWRTTAHWTNTKYKVSPQISHKSECGAAAVGQKSECGAAAVDQVVLLTETGNMYAGATFEQTVFSPCKDAPVNTGRNNSEARHGPRRPALRLRIPNSFPRGFCGIKHQRHATHQMAAEIAGLRAALERMERDQESDRQRWRQELSRLKEVVQQKSERAQHERDQLCRGYLEMRGKMRSLQQEYMAIKREHAEENHSGKNVQVKECKEEVRRLKQEYQRTFGKMP